ncbi:MAG TPA: twin-arginine translocase TatA/TatE family subunit [Solirubrobacterales bacterium]|nr:twin-arginine translocase TatA/TatE family subunit [Solirubrobacterales bacterium]
MPNVGPLEILLVLIVALVVFGPKKLPDLGHSLGKGIREFKGSVTGENDEPTHVEPARVETARVEVAPVTTHRVEDTHTHA